MVKLAILYLKGRKQTNASLDVVVKGTAPGWTELLVYRLHVTQIINTHGGRLTANCTK